jgi:hypothetical protein
MTWIGAAPRLPAVKGLSPKRPAVLGQDRRTGEPDAGRSGAFILLEGWVQADRAVFSARPIIARLPTKEFAMTAHISVALDDEQKKRFEVIAAAGAARSGGRRSLGRISGL